MDRNKPAVDLNRRRLSTGIKHSDISDLTAGRGGASSGLTLDSVCSGEPGIVLKTTQEGNTARLNSFDEKPSKVLCSSEGKPSVLEKMKKEGIYAKCKKGKKPECPNQDSFSVIIKESGEKLFCVFDGHGPGGHEVSDYCADMLPALFFDKMKKGNGSDDSIKQCLHESFVECQKLLAATDMKKYRSDDSGSTCTVAYRAPGSTAFFFAHVGDSRAVLCRDGKNVVVELTEDHKPDLPGEKKRIESKGGRVEWDGYFNHRVYTAEGKGGLNMSRALGDNYVKPAGVTEVPEIKKYELQSTDKFVMLCSDGVWEFIKNEVASEIIAKYGKEKVDAAAEELAKRSYQEWMTDSDNDISDDITVLVYWL